MNYYSTLLNSWCGRASHQTEFTYSNDLNMTVFLFWFQYIIKSDIVIIPEVEESNRRIWPIALMLGLLLVAAAALATAFLLQTKDNGLYTNHMTLCMWYQYITNRY